MNKVGLNMVGGGRYGGGKKWEEMGTIVIE